MTPAGALPIHSMQRSRRPETREQGIPTLAFFAPSSWQLTLASSHCRAANNAKQLLPDSTHASIDGILAQCNTHLDQLAAMHAECVNSQDDCKSVGEFVTEGEVLHAKGIELAGMVSGGADGDDDEVALRQRQHGGLDRVAELAQQKALLSETMGDKCTGT